MKKKVSSESMVKDIRRSGLPPKKLIHLLC